MFAAIVALQLAANGLNVVNSYVNRNLMSAIAERQTAEFVRQALFTLAVFVGFTIVAVLARIRNQERSVSAYIASGTYYRLATSGELCKPG